jgi:hypothetical protein
VSVHSVHKQVPGDEVDLGMHRRLHAKLAGSGGWQQGVPAHLPGSGIWPLLGSKLEC